MVQFQGDVPEKKTTDMMGRGGVVSRKEAQDLFFRKFVPPSRVEEEVPVHSALGRIISRDITSAVDLPAFARATMDGYALRAQDTFGAGETLPAYLNLIGDVPMGERPEVKVRPQGAARIATGGMLPEGADAVVMFEQTSAVDEVMIEVIRPVAPGENVIQAGEDIERDLTVFEEGHRIRPQDIGALSGLGITETMVYRRPRVSIVPTGNEIIAPDRSPGPGQIRDINSPHLAALVEQLGAMAVRFEVVADEEKPLKEAVLQALEESDLVLLSGGSSVGIRDLTAKVVGELGGPGIVVHGVAVKPGKPTLCALVQGKPVVGLPGHPAAVAIAFDLFVKPLIRILSGEKMPVWMKAVDSSVAARMTRNISSRAGREDYVRVALELKEGGLWARPILGKSGLISTLVNAAGILVVPENKLGLEKGEAVEVRLFQGTPEV